MTKKKQSLKALQRENVELDNALYNVCVARDSYKQEVAVLKERNGVLYKSVNELNLRVSRQAQELGEASQKLDAYERLLKANDKTCEEQANALSEQRVEIEQLQGQVNTLMAHREALLDAAATVRFVAEAKAQGKL